MDLGIGLPSAVPGIDGRAVVDWARAAEAAGFHTVAAVDRVAFVTTDPFVSLAVAAAATERVRLMTAIALAPLRATGLLAKEAASLDRLSGGRFTLGVGVGSRRDDYVAAGAEDRFHRRGTVLDHQLADLAMTWRPEPSTAGLTAGTAPLTVGGPPVLVGGASPATWARTARYGAGWISGRGGVATFASHAAEVRAAWARAGRSGQPRLLALVYFSLGGGAPEVAEAYVRGYYGYAPFVDALVASVSTSPEAVQATVSAYAEAGCDELLLFPCNPAVDQVGLLAGATGRLAPS